MKLKTKIFFGFFGFVALTVGGILAVMMLLKHELGIYQNIIDIDLKREVKINETARELGRFRFLVNKYKFDRQDEDFKKVEESHKKVLTHFNEIKAMSNSEELVAISDQIQTKLSSKKEALKSMFDNLSVIGKKDAGLVGQARKDVHYLETEIKKNNLGDHFLVSLLMMRRHEKDFLLRHDKKYIDKLAKEIETFKGHLDRDILSPEKNTEIKGKLDSYKSQIAQIADKTISGNELSNDIFEAINSSIDKMKDITDISITNVDAAVAQANLDQRRITYLIYVTIAILALFMSVIYMLINRNVIKKIEHIVENLSNISQHNEKLGLGLNESAQKLNDTVERQSKAVQESVAANDEMTSMIMQTAENTNNSTKLVDDISSKAVDGNKIMLELGKSMSLIEESNGELEDMVRIIEQISEKTNVINDIVFQTQLLSFNASIEAARAGQHGKGFAVVATEVANLANMSGKAASEIKALLQSSQKQVDNIVTGNKDKVDQGKQVSEKAQMTFNQITEGVQTIADNIRSISAATREQEIGVKQGSEALKEIESVSLVTTGIANETRISSKEIKDNSVDLEQWIQTLDSIISGREVELAYAEDEEFLEDIESDDDLAA